MKTSKQINIHKCFPVMQIVGGIAIILFAVLSFSAFAAETLPDAGQIQRDIERDRFPGALPRPSTVPGIEEPVRPALTAPKTARFLVKGFRISRAAAFPEAELLSLLQDFVGRELSIADLRRAADIITSYYREHGYFVARAYIPRQDIKDGIVEILVIEGKVERISVKPVGKVRLKSAVVEKTLSGRLPADGLINKANLERSLLLLNDLPGVDVRSTLSPGAAIGTSLLAAEVTEGPLVSGNVDIDNHGNKFSGEYRLGTTLNLNDPSGRGDLLALRAMVSSGIRYGRFGYQLPVGTSGLKAGAAFTDMSYELSGEFAALEARGYAQVATMNALYPFVRGRDFSLYATATYDNKRFYNSTLAGATSDKKIHVATFGISGDSLDFQGGVNTFRLTLFTGSLNLDGWAPDRAADDATAFTDGHYVKTTYSLARLQRLGEATSFYAELSGQLASKNLDSSEKFVLGGAQGVRAYPLGEAAGDEGMLLNLELRYDVNQTLQLAAFIDHGKIRLHREEWIGWQGNNTRIGNRYELSGYGLGLRWSIPGDLLVRASVAQRMGENPGRDINDNDSDNDYYHTRLWLQGVKYF
jgi:hemolysin activation/secretion protein